MEKKSPPTLSHWMMAIRPKTLPAAVGPVLVGSAMAYVSDAFHLLPALGCLLASFFLQIGVNLANDYFDYKGGIDSEERLGPVRVTQSGLIAPETVRLAMFVCLGCAALIFLYLAVVGGMVLVVIGIVSIIAAFGYSGGPWPLASHGMGELFVFIFFGLVAVGGTYWVQAHQMSWLVMLAAIPPGLLISAIMMVNNLRDIDTDRKAGKNTLAVKLGQWRTIQGYRVLLLASYIVPVVFILLGGKSALILPFITLPVAIGCMRCIGCESGDGLNGLLARTARLSFLYCLLFAAGLVYGLT